MTSLDITRIRELMKEKGFTQTRLAEKIGVDETTISKWLSGKAVPKENLYYLAQVLGAHESELLETDSNDLGKKNTPYCMVQNCQTTVQQINVFFIKEQETIELIREIVISKQTQQK